ncbi:MAG: hypothetical protein LBV46_01715, partial [Bacteroidales bacterium]|nr:hypothetical protein [Bacteroidales bacterium]
MIYKKTIVLLAILLLLTTANKAQNPVISVHPDEMNMIIEAGCKGYLRKGQLHINQYRACSQCLLTYFENHGYPFAEVSLDSVLLTTDTIFSLLKIKKNTYIYLDSIVLAGNLKLSKWFLYPYLSWRKGKRYNEAQLKEIPNKLNNIPFATEIRSSGIEFVEDKASLYLFLDKK